MYEKLALIYSTLQDDESRMIFEKRLLFSLLGNEKHMQEMIHALIEQYGERDRVYHLLQWLSANEEEKIVIFGAGTACRHLLWILNSYNRKVDYLYDNKKTLHGTELYGIPVLSLEQLEAIKSECCVIVGVNLYTNEISKQLQELGFADNKVFTADNGWWLGDQRQYFDSHIMTPREREVFVDGGALDGADTLAFRSWCSGIEGKAYLFEPDEDNYLRTSKNVSEFKEALVIKKGLWSCEQNLRFSNDTSQGASINKEGKAIIQAVPLDKMFEHEQVTFIKMDIEGAELEALKGAKNVIQRDKPRLAICVYHKREDIISIPEYLLTLNPDYKFYLRHYGYLPLETVLYAI